MMKNLEVLEEIRKQGKNLIETKRDEFVKQNLLSDEFIQMMQKNKKPFELLMSYYQCAIMEIETKFRVLNQEYSLSYDQNPIEGIKTRVKSYESIMRKIRVKDIPVTLESIEENIRDIAGVRVICSFPSDIYKLADSFLKQDDITLIERKDYSASEGERLPQSSSDRSGADLFTGYKETGLRGSTVPYDRDGFLGESGAQDALQEKYSRKSCQISAG